MRTQEIGTRVVRVRIQEIGIENSRDWGRNLFRDETDVNKKLYPDKTKNIS